ncbi:MAG: HupE/UreJ family protein [Pseudomonadota bacterium]
MTKRTICVLLSVILGCLTVGSALAHDTPIARLDLREIQTGVFVERWTYSSAYNLDAPTPVYPEHCVVESPKVSCGERGLTGTLSMEKLGERYSATVVRLALLDGQRTSFTLTAAAPEVSLSATGVLPLGALAAAYIPLGFEHILLGFDHLLFVLGLMLLVSNRWMLVKTITAFTIAHSITLAAATFGWVGVRETAVNAAIALSIVFVAIEVLKLRQGREGLSSRYPWAVAFGFGLLHGFGFAGALTSIGLPAENLPAALLFFNVGVELGQLAFVFLIIAIGWAHRELKVVLPRWTEAVAVYAMGSLAAFWFLDRFGAILSPLTA